MKLEVPLTKGEVGVLLKMHVQLLIKFILISKKKREKEKKRREYEPRMLMH